MQETQKLKYAVIVDAGSSGSRIYVYSYDPKQAAPNPSQVKGNDGKEWSYKVTPGISSKAEKLGEVEAYVKDLITMTKSLPLTSFPISAHAETPIFWFATAGMRLLTADVADALTNKLREVLKDKSVVPFKFQNSWARTLSGEEEGAFAWISLNHKNGLFIRKGVQDYGVVETGGASAQMTFLEKGNILSNKFPVIINKKVYPLYTHSYLYFGQDQVKKRVLKNECLCLPKNKMKGCKPRIEKNKYNGKPVDSACMIKGYTTKKAITVEGKEFEIDIEGTGNPSKCAEEMDYLFRTVMTCFTKPCSFAGIYQPPFDTHNKFYGTSAVRYAIAGLGMLKGSNDVTWPEVRTAADKYCKMPLNKLDTKDEYAWMRCLTGIYMAKEFEHLQFAKDHKITIEKFDTWTIGAVLYQLELLEILLPPNAGRVNYRK